MATNITSVLNKTHGLEADNSSWSIDDAGDDLEAAGSE